MLPTIAVDVHATPAASIWVVNAYQLALVACLLPFSSLGEIFGYRRVYTYGLVMFTGASLVCALSWSLPTLTAARVLQGVGAAGIMSVNTALIRFIYPARKLGKGVGLNALTVAVSTALGPTVAGRHPVGCLVAVAVRHQRPARRRGPDAGGPVPADDPARDPPVRPGERGC